MASRQLDEILVVDLESTCWEPESSKPANEVSDIIEIGVCHVDLKTLEPTKNWNVLIKPTRSTVSAFSQSLNHLSQEELYEKGESLQVAFGLLRAEKSHNKPWASYGDYDRKKIEKDCKDLDIQYPFGPRHLNVKALFAYGMGLDREVGMAQALEILHKPLEGKHHSGKDDATNIAKILCYLLRKIRENR